MERQKPGHKDVDDTATKGRRKKDEGGLGRLVPGAIQRRRVQMQMRLAQQRSSAKGGVNPLTDGS
jgi:hypothetical protein